MGPNDTPTGTLPPALSGLSVLAQPGAVAVGAAPAMEASGSMPAPNPPTAPAETLTPGMAAPDVTDRSINPAVPPAAPAGVIPAGGHTKLLAMVQGLGIGLSAAGKALATHGREGGAADVIAQEGAIQEQKERTQASAQALKDSQLRNQLTTAQTNEVMSATARNTAMLPNEIETGHLNVEKMQAEADERAQTMVNQGYQVPGYNVDPQTGQAVRIKQNQPAGQTPAAPAPGGAAPAVTPVQVPAGTPDVLLGVTPGAPAAVPGAPAAAGAPTAQSSIPRNAPFFLRRQAIIEEGSKVLTAANGGKPTADVDAANAVLNDPKSTVYQINMAANLIQQRAQLSTDTVKRLTDVADLAAKQTTAQFAVPKAQADIALANARTTAATLAAQKTASELKALRTGDSNLSGPEYLKSLPASRASNVQAFGEGRAQVNSRSFATPAGQALLSDITAAYPDYDQTKAATWDKTRNEYMGSGATAKKTVSYNTALEHMQDLYNNSTKEGLYLPGSKAYSDRSVALGYVSNEVGNAIKTGVMSKDEGEQILSSLKGWTPSTAKERVAETARLLYDKIEEYQTKFADGAPSSAVKVPTLISPKAQSAYNSVQGINQAPAAPTGATGKAKGPDGKFYYHDAKGNNLGLVQ